MQLLWFLFGKCDPGFLVSGIFYSFSELAPLWKGTLIISEKNYRNSVPWVLFYCLCLTYFAAETYCCIIATDASRSNWMFRRQRSRASIPSLLACSIFLSSSSEILDKSLGGVGGGGMGIPENGKEWENYNLHQAHVWTDNTQRILFDFRFSICTGNVIWTKFIRF